MSMRTGGRAKPEGDEIVTAESGRRRLLAAAIVLAAGLAQLLAAPVP